MNTYNCNWCRMPIGNSPHVAFKVPCTTDQYERYHNRYRNDCWNAAYIREMQVTVEQKLLEEGENDAA